MNNKPFKQAPLPFIGQKRMFLNAFQKVLKEHIPSDAEGCNRMSDYQRINIQTRLNYSSVYEDNLTYKFS
ncbi:hypothetical protein [Dichelobacter nodosus]|uniref:Uncharacterized protein n=1 Tax=Dichelobacter nodosus (strain VCS1703A) TaxID=246195 RepID=A5EUZ3_DICNV|nr:hypothetical protein [Dichelobacter nodosus]ABQ14118.1 hypothetical protein DNO_0754 [Dichelobacter nodosus VCS1703A]